MVQFEQIQAKYIYQNLKQFNLNIVFFFLSKLEYCVVDGI